MNLFADEGVDRPIADALRDAGYRVWYVAEMSPSLSDEEALAAARRADALLLTADKDFGALVFRLQRLTRGVILIRLAGMPLGEKARRVVWAIQVYGPQMQGSFTVITPKTVRIRPLEDWTSGGAAP